jgi:predicted Zn-ribbon and HTH transcriptional regulator
MSNAEALRKLAKEVIDAHEDRVVLKASILSSIDQIKSEVKECQKDAVNLLKMFTNQHQEMREQLRTDLDQFMSGLNEAESVRLSNARENASQRQNEISQRIAVVDDFRKDVVDELRRIADSHKEMGRQLRTDLGQFMSILNAADSSRLSIAREDAGQRRDDISQIIAVVDDLRKDVIDKLREMTDAHKEMGGQLQSDLNQFMSGLNAAESIRLSNAMKDAGQRQSEISQRIAVVDDLRKDIVDELQKMAEAHQEMAKQLKTDLDQFASGLSTAELDRKAAAHVYLDEVQADIRETASAWKELIQNIQAARATPNAPVANKSEDTAPAETTPQAPVLTKPEDTAPAETTPQAPVLTKSEDTAPAETTPQAPVLTKSEDTAPAENAAPFPPHEKKTSFNEVKESSSDKTIELEDIVSVEDIRLDMENIREKIIWVLQGHADGMRMTQIAEQLNVENWRSLIPVMRELLDEQVLEKEGSLYLLNRRISG